MGFEYFFIDYKGDENKFIDKVLYLKNTWQPSSKAFCNIILWNKTATGLASCRQCNVVWGMGERSISIFRAFEGFRGQWEIASDQVEKLTPFKKLVSAFLKYQLLHCYLFTKLLEIEWNVHFLVPT